jgi:putative tryptophan/tyrosine transport system substrate-binding protein
MRRRDFIKIVAGSAAGAWPLAAVQAQGAMPVIGFLNVQSASGRPHQLDAFRRGLSSAGYTENKNIAIEYRWADNRYDRLPELAADLARLKVAVIVATGGAQAALAAKAATSTIPIVFTAGSDPVRAGLVPSLNRPGGNVTGFSFLTDALAAKRLGLLREIVRAPTTVAVLINPDGPDAQGQLKDVRAAADAIGQSIDILMASTQEEIESAFAKISKNHAGALIVGADPFFNDRRQQIVALAARASLPAVYESREFVLVGGLMSYGASITDAYRQAGVYTARILNGEKPAELPVIQATKFDFVFNSKTARALGVQLNPQVLATADEVIE